MVFAGAPHDARRSAVALAAAAAATKAKCGVSTAVAMDESIRKALRAQWVFFPTRVARTAPPLVSVNHGSLRCRWADALATAAAIIKSSSSSSNSSWFNVFNIPLIFTLSRQNSFWCIQGLPGTARLTNFSALICTGNEEFSPCFSRTWRLQREDPELEPCPKMDENGSIPHHSIESKENCRNVENLFASLEIFSTSPAQLRFCIWLGISLHKSHKASCKAPRRW